MSSPVGLSGQETLVTYSDVESIEQLPHTGASITGPWWHHTWSLGRGPHVDKGDVVEFTLDISTLDSPLGPNSPVNVEVISAEGAAIKIARTTQMEIQRIMNLD